MTRKIYLMMRTKKENDKDKSISVVATTSNEMYEFPQSLTWFTTSILAAYSLIRGSEEGREGGRRFIRNSPGEEGAQKEELDCVTRTREAS